MLKLELVDNIKIVGASSHAESWIEIAMVGYCWMVYEQL
jgi:hypothetical protein